jgi:hypothetical protein
MDISYMTIDQNLLPFLKVAVCIFGAVITTVISIIAFGVRRILVQVDDLVTRREWISHNKAEADERESIRKDVEHCRERTEKLEDRLMNEHNK